MTVISWYTGAGRESAGASALKGCGLPTKYGAVRKIHGMHRAGAAHPIAACLNLFLYQLAIS